ncbi:unnamed protein product, partial [Mesorhabditis spiculigera]
MLSVLCIVTALMIVESCSPLLKNGTLPATIGGLVSPDGSTATAVLTLDTNTPYGLAVNDTAVALLPISAQLRQLQDPRIKGDPRIVQIDPLNNGTATRLVVAVDVSGNNQEVADLLRRTFSVNDAVNKFDIELPGQSPSK